MTHTEVLHLALEALENSVDLVREDAYNAEELYGNYPARQGKVRGLKVLADDHEKAITAIKAALEAKNEPVVWNEGVPAMLPKQKEGETFIVSYEPKLEAKDEPVAKNEEGRITWLVDNWPQNCLLYTHPPQSFTYEQVKAHIRAASMSANDISVGSDTTEDGVSIVIRRRDELLYAEFFAYTQPQRKPLTDEEIHQIFIANSVAVDNGNAYMVAGLRTVNITRAIEAAHGIKGEA